MNRKKKQLIKIIAALADFMQIEALQNIPASVLSFSGLEIRQNQHRVFQDGEEINLTRLEYNTLVLPASNPDIIFTQTQIFEAV